MTPTELSKMSRLELEQTALKMQEELNSISRLFHGPAQPADSPISEEIKGAQTIGVKRHGSPLFYQLLEQMADVHDRKSHDYASNNNPYGNYYFAGELSKLFDSPHDSGFLGRLGEKIYRLANIENRSLNPANETVEDTERDICVITVLWMASRMERRRAHFERISKEHQNTQSSAGLYGDKGEPTRKTPTRRVGDMRGSG